MISKTAHYLNPAPPLPKRKDRLMLGLALVLGGGLSLLACLALRQLEDLRERQQWVVAAESVRDAFAQDLTLSIEAVRGMALMIESHKDLNQSVFNTYAEKTLRNLRYVTIVEWQPIVPAAELHHFEARARAAGLRDYQVVQPNSTKTGFEPVYGRDTYVPVLFAWPEKFGTVAYDMSFSPERMESKLQSRLVGHPVASGVFEIQKENTITSGDMGIAVSTTVFRDNQNPLGYLAAVIDLKILFHEAAQRADAANMDLRVYDNSAQQSQPFFARLDADSTPSAKQTVDLLPYREGQKLSLNVAGRDWSLVLHPRPKFAQDMLSRTSNQALAFGLGITTLLLLAIVRVQRSRRLVENATREARSAEHLLSLERERILELNFTLEHRVEERTAALSIAKQAEAELLRFKNVLDNTLDMIFMFELEFFLFVYVNQGTLLGTGYSREELLGMAPYQINPLMTEPDFRQLIAPLLSGEQPSLRFDTVHRRKDGTDFPVDVFLQLVTQNDGSSLFVAIVRDVTEKNKSEELIWKQANFDTLTGLPNRRMFHDKLAQEIKKSHRSGLPMVLMLLDLDHFKGVNDTLGHAQGDVLLVEAARRIAECVRESDTVARLGGDEFTVILSEMADVNSVERIVQNIIERLADPFQLLQDTAYVSASVGITLYPDDAQNIDNLLKNADQAMYLAKNSGRNRFRYFTAALQEVAQTHMRLGSDLRGALVGQEFRVFYQPIVTLATGAIHKAEALLCWQHPTRGLISPAEFIPVAEETGMIIDIGDWVFREVASQAAHWRASHYPKFQISVNISPVQFRHKGTNFKAWLDYLQKLGLPGQNIVMEITEGLLLDADTSVTDQLLAFRDAGIRVSLDDFGTGYSSLSYLKKFDIDYLKIDQLFVRNLEEDANDRALCEAIIVMAHKLGLKVIAEGVETGRQRDLLAAYGCDYAQGWLYSKAVPPEQFEALLQERAK